MQSADSKFLILFIKLSWFLYVDGTNTIYVNAAVDDGSEVAKLMRYSKTADPDDMSQGELSRRGGCGGYDQSLLCRYFR